MRKAVRRVVSATVVCALFVVGGLALSALTAGSIAAARQPNPTLDDLVNAGGTVLAWLLFGYLALGALLALLAALPGAVGETFAVVSERVTPRAYRRAAQMALGLTVVAGPALGAATAHAAPSDAHIAGRTSSASTSYQTNRLDLDLPGNLDLPESTPDRAGTRLQLDLPGHTGTGPIDQLDLDLPGHRDGDTGQPTAGGRGAAGRPAADPIMRPVRDHVHTGHHPDHQVQTYTVKRGDCLWNIAKAHLPAGASEATIDAEWHRWYAANRQVVGDNPDLIHPGQILHAPPG